MLATFCPFLLQVVAVAEQVVAFAEHAAAWAEVQAAAFSVEHVVAETASFLEAQQASPALATTANAVTVRIIRSFFIDISWLFR